MLNKFDSSVVVDTNRPYDQWAVYEHQVVMVEGEPPQVIMIGVCKLTEVYRLHDGKRNTEWLSIFKNGGSVLVRIRAIATDRGDANYYAQDLLRASNPRPVCNMKGFNARAVSRQIECIQNGKTYATQAEAARDLGLHQAGISRQLNGEIAHVGGFQFVYHVPEVQV